MSGEMERNLERRLTFEKAYTTTPLQLKQWIEANASDHYLALNLWQKFIFPLQCEIETLRHYPERAIPFDAPTDNGPP